MVALAGSLALLASLQSPAAAVCNQENDEFASQADSYSTGRSGSRLKWVSARPEPAGDRQQQTANARHDPRQTSVTAAGYTAPAETPRPLPASRDQNSGPTPKLLSSPPGNPLGEGTGGPKPALIDRRGDDLLQLPAKNGTAPPPTEPEVNTQLKETCPTVKDLKHIADLSTNITPSEGDLPHDCPLGGAALRPRCFAPMTYTWTASALCHKPLYFEDVQLERYGHMLGPWSQPIASAANFFVSIPALPYKMGLEPPSECIYALGYYRPGDCAPYMIDPFPISVRGALFEAGVVVGGVAIFP
jgi:hypothetical protein